MRVVSLDPDTIAILTAHKQSVQRGCTELGTTLDDDAFVFSYAPDHRRHCDPDGVTHRYTKMIADLGIDTHLHALRHYSATELIAAGVDVRTAAAGSGTVWESDNASGLCGVAGRHRQEGHRAGGPRDCQSHRSPGLGASAATPSASVIGGTVGQSESVITAYVCAEGLREEWSTPSLS